MTLNAYKEAHDKTKIINNQECKCCNCISKKKSTQYIINNNSSIGENDVKLSILNDILYCIIIELFENKNFVNTIINDIHNKTFYNIKDNNYLKNTINNIIINKSFNIDNKTTICLLEQEILLLNNSLDTQKLFIVKKLISLILKLSKNKIKELYNLIKNILYFGNDIVKKVDNKETIKNDNTKDNNYYNHNESKNKKNNEYSNNLFISKDYNNNTLNLNINNNLKDNNINNKDYNYLSKKVSRPLSYTCSDTSYSIKKSNNDSYTTYDVTNNPKKKLLKNITYQNNSIGNMIINFNNPQVNNLKSNSNEKINNNLSMTNTNYSNSFACDIKNIISDNIDKNSNEIKYNEILLKKENSIDNTYNNNIIDNYNTQNNASSKLKKNSFNSFNDKFQFDPISIDIANSNIKKIKTSNIILSNKNKAYNN